MPSPEEYRNRAKEARKQANACRNEWERQGLLIIAEQCERLAAYKDLTGRSVPATAPTQDDLKERGNPWRTIPPPTT
jgi:hypothetical protein